MNSLAFDFLFKIPLPEKNRYDHYFASLQEVFDPCFNLKHWNQCGTVLLV